MRVAIKNGNAAGQREVSLGDCGVGIAEFGLGAAAGGPQEVALPAVWPLRWISTFS
jgi:hypothetical protein